MKRQKHFFSAVLALCIAVGLLSCSDEEPEPAAESTDTEAAQYADEPSAEDALADPVSDAPAPDAGDRPYVERNPRDGIVVAEAYQRECPVVEEPSDQCVLLRSLVVTYVTLALEDLELTRDQRATTEALKALNVADEPEILIAAMRVLGSFPETPGIAEKALPLLLDSPWLEVQRVAAQLLSRVPDPAVSGLGYQWVGHSTLPYPDDPYAELPPFPEHYWDMGFPEYPGVEWFSVADSDRSVGWITTDSPEVVINTLSEMTDAPVLNYDAWSVRSREAMMSIVQPSANPLMAEFQKLMEDYMSTADPKLLEKIESMKDEMELARQRQGEVLNNLLNDAAQPPSYAPADQWSFLINEERDGRVSRLISVYPVPALGKTVIQMTWDLNDYAPAWEEPQ
jgi:hypothetical protein